MDSLILQAAAEARKKLKYREALALYEQALQAEPEDIKAAEGAAYCLYAVGRDEQAQTMCEQIVERDPSRATAHMILSCVYDNRRDLEKSRDEIVRALDLDPNSAEVLSCYGTILLEANELDDAVRYLRKAIEIDPEMFLAHHNLAVCYERKGDMVNLRREVNIVFRQRPNVLNAIRLLAVHISTNRILFSMALLLPAIGLYLGFRAALVFHAVVIGIYVLAAALMFRQRRSDIAVRNLAIALAIAMIDALLLLAVFH